MVLGRNAYVLKFTAVELDRWILKELLQEKTAKNMAYGEAVWLGRFVHIICRNHASGAGHVVNNDSRITGNVLSHLAGDDPRIQIVAAAWCKPHDKADRFTLIKGRL